MAAPKPYRLASRDSQASDTVVQVGSVSIGGADRLVVMAAMEAVGRVDALVDTARRLAESGADLLHGRRPAGDGEAAERTLERLTAIRAETGLPVAGEVRAPGEVELAARHLDMLQIDAHHMQDYALLREAGTCGRPILLERGFSSTVDEWLLAAEYLLSGGNRGVVLCERGIRTFEPTIPFTLDLNAMVVADELTHLPVVVDPTRGVDTATPVLRLALAAAAAGARGLVLEVRPPCPEAPLRFTTADFGRLIERLGHRRLAADSAPLRVVG